MKHLYLFFFLPIALFVARELSVQIHSHSEEVLVISGMASQAVSAEQTEYEYTLLCPKCNEMMTAKFKKGYRRAVTKTICPKASCRTSWTITYNWSVYDKPPQIVEIKQTGK